jgi:hypothetical protein
LINGTSFFLIHRVLTLGQINFGEITTEMFTQEDLKSVASVLGQTLALILGSEVYTKGDVRTYFPPLAPFLARSPEAWDHLSVLEMFKQTLLTSLRGLVIHQLDARYHFFTVPVMREDNALEAQTCGMLIDLYPGVERCLFWSPEPWQPSNRALAFVGDVPMLFDGRTLAAIETSERDHWALLDPDGLPRARRHRWSGECTD